MQPDDILRPGDREVIDLNATDFHPYNRYGRTNPDMEWLPLSGDAREGFETFLIKMKPGAQSFPHQHTQREEFLVLDGSITDCDGVEFKRGDYVKFKPGSTHHSTSKNGCTLLVILTGPNRLLQDAAKTP